MHKYTQVSVNSIPTFLQNSTQTNVTIINSGNIFLGFAVWYVHSYIIVNK